MKRADYGDKAPFLLSLIVNQTKRTSFYLIARWCGAYAMSFLTEGLDDHLGHHLVPESRWVVGEAGDAEHVLGALRPLL